MSSKTMKAEPQLLPSPPPSPTPSDTSTARDAGAPDSINEAYLTPASSTANKGKGRIVDSPIDSQQSDQDDDSDEYHPNEMETKRIEDTLRRWEAEERERRRIARESGYSVRYSVLDVTRTASSIWAGLRSQRPLSRTGGGGGHHHVLPDNEGEDGLPLEDLDRTPPPSGANTPTMDRRFSPTHSNSASTIDNPFENPRHIRNASTSSLNTPDHSTILTESSEPPSMLLNSPAAEQKRKGGPPPPQPLGLPKPRPPPPRDGQDPAYINEPPDQTAAPSITAEETGHDPDESEKDVKWWTEWLCGCSEGPDRGGFNQSGRTNPNE